MSPRYAIVVRAYPNSYRHECGDELVETANELADHRWSFRQARSLAFEGLRTRARISTNGSPRLVWANGIAVALGLWYLLRTAMPMTYLLGATGDVSGFSQSPRATMGFALVPLVGLVLTTRWPTAVLVTLTAIFAAIQAYQNDSRLFDHDDLVSALISQGAIIGLAWWLALRGQGRRAFSPPTAIVLLAAFVATSYVFDSPGVIEVLALLYIGLPILGLVMVTIDPRVLVAATTLWLLRTIWSVSMVLAFGIDDLLYLLMIAVPMLVTGIGTMLSRYGIRRLTTP
ncbi:MAG: hypothetical protein GY773_03995 [Actinomycetia bacterium]|nr:hypothetical protein [Actinomycetes bacterium]